ncbi:MAG TPA: hypothetical protein VFG54_14065 [Prolixibacteraceae bacterium]|nr:hypothetical protein [Prolixibacteraceae bacterium]
MKNLVTLFVLLCWACAKTDVESEKKIITQLIDDETKYAAAADSVNWSNSWINNKEARFLFVSDGGAQEYKSWDTIKSLMMDAKPFELKIKRDNYNFTIGKDVAFISFDQQDNWGGVDGHRTMETRTLKKVDGHWKIVDANVIEVSAFDKKPSSSFHIAKEKIAVDQRTSLRNQSGLGGMTVAYWEAPAGTDFAPLLAGLPQDLCPVPHWGYVIEGAIRLKYQDGKEEVVNGGEVFYWPGMHTGKVEKNAKFIDFSPESEFTQLMDHIAKNMEAQKTK